MEYILDSLWTFFPNYWIMTVALLLAGLCKGLMDRLQFHFSTIPGFFKKRDLFWNPKISWARKYDPSCYVVDVLPSGEKTIITRYPLKPRFFGSTTFLVWSTDGWHLVQMIFLNLIAIAAASATVAPIFSFIVVRIFMWLGFAMIYK